MTEGFYPIVEYITDENIKKKLNKAHGGKIFVRRQDKTLKNMKHNIEPEMGNIDRREGRRSARSSNGSHKSYDNNRKDMVIGLEFTPKNPRKIISYSNNADNDEQIFIKNSRDMPSGTAKILAHNQIKIVNTNFSSTMGPHTKIQRDLNNK